MKNKNLRLWHYTPATRLPDILVSGYLRPSIEPGENEKPVVWFSSNPSWERSVVKYGRTEEQELLFLTETSMKETIGLGRIEVKYTENIIPWMEAKETNGVHSIINEFSEIAGELLDGNPKEWFASHTKCHMKDWLSVEIWKNGIWQPLDSEDGSKDLLKLEGCKNIQIIDM